MIELERGESQDIQVWADSDFRHVIVRETEGTYRYGSGGSGYYVRDEIGEVGPYLSLGEAFEMAQDRWGEVTLAPANRLARNLAEGREHAVADYLLEYLAKYGAVGIDVQALAQLVMTRQEGA